MYSIGIDAHKKSLVIHVVDEKGERVDRTRINCQEVRRFRSFLRKWTPCQTVVEACNLADWISVVCREETERFVLAHPSRVRLIAQTVKKTDRVDARILAELLARNYIPEAYMPTPEERQDRSLVRTRAWVAREIRRAKARIRTVLNRHNLTREKNASPFTREGRRWLRELEMGRGERMEIDTALAMLEAAEQERKTVDASIRSRARTNPEVKRLQTIPGVGPLTALALVATLGDWTRFKSLRKVTAYLGLCPTVDQSARRCHLGHITRAGDGLTRGLLVEAAWHLVRSDVHWKEAYEHIVRRRGKKIAIVAIARRLLRTAVAMLRDGVDFVSLPRPVEQTAA